MLRRLATAVVRHRRAVLAGALLALIASFAYGGKVATKLNNGGFADPSSPSSRAQNLLDSQFHTGAPNLVLVVTATSGTVDSPQVTAEGRALTAQLAAMHGVDGATSYWSLGNVPPLRSTDGTKALILARLTGTDDQVNARVHQIEPALVGRHGSVEVAVTGQAAVFRQVGDTIRRDLAKAEGIAVPITMALLVFVFGSVVAAALPLAVGALAVGGTFAALTALVSVTKVSIFSLNLTTALGLGLAIDYSLFVVNRYREELRNGLSPDAAVVRTVETAGRTVLFSAATVGVSLAALLVFPLYFLRSFAYAGVAVVAVAAHRRRGRAPGAAGRVRPQGRCPRCPQGHPPPVRAGAARSRGGRGLLAPPGQCRHAPAPADRDRHHRRAAGSRRPLPRRPLRPARRPGAPRLGVDPRRLRRSPAGLRLGRGQRLLRGRACRGVGNVGHVVRRGAVAPARGGQGRRVDRILQRR